MTKKSKFTSVPLTLGLLSLLIFPKVTAAVIIGEYSTLPVSMVSGIDCGLTADPDGNIWFAVTYRNQLGRITPAGKVTVFPLPFGSLTGSIVTGPDGNIWYSTEFSGKVGRITPTAEVTEFPVSLDGIKALAAGPDGNVWFGGSRSGNAVMARITPGGVITEFQVPSWPIAITAGPDGNLWFVEIGANKIGRMTTSGVVTEFTVPTANAFLYSITTGPDGNLWFTEGTADKIGRISPAGVITEFSIPWPGCGPYSVHEVVSITSGPDGNLWFTDNTCDKIGRIAPDGTFLPELATPSAFSAPQHITASPDGLIWFTESLNAIGVISQGKILDYLPLITGNSWTYEESGGSSDTRTVTPGVTNINGINSKAIQSSNGYQVYYTNDNDGIREHREFDPEPPPGTLTLNPPFKVVDSKGMLGVAMQTSGAYNATVGGDSLSGSYQGTSTLEAFDKITVPAGTFNTIRVRSRIYLWDDDILITETIWFAENVGVVKALSDGDTAVMSGTNVIDTVPDSFWFKAKRDVGLKSVVTSNTITVTGITAPASISITGGDYSINLGPYTNAPGTVANGQSVTVRQISASTPRTRTKATLTIGGISATLDVTTSNSKAMPWIPLLLGD